MTKEPTNSELRSFIKWLWLKELDNARKWVAEDYPELSAIEAEKLAGRVLRNLGRAKGVTVTDVTVTKD